MLQQIAPVAPMLASPLACAPIDDWSLWAAEEKYDGHRVSVCVCHGRVLAWSRSGSAKRLPKHLKAELALLPDGAYDGELVAGNTATDVSRVDLADSLACKVFDVLYVGGADVTERPYAARRRMLSNAVFYNLCLPSVRLAEAWPLTCEQDAMSLAESVWSRGGEGLILKRLDAPYLPGKRSANWRKIKQVQSSVLRVIGFANSSRPYSCLLLRDDQGNETVVKARNNAELAMLQHDAAFTPHPAIGRLLRIEYQGRTESGGYRNPRWDRWEDT